MPVNDRYPLPEVLAACERFYERKRRMVFVEYVMLGGINDTVSQASELAEILAELRQRDDVPSGLHFIQRRSYLR